MENPTKSYVDSLYENSRNNCDLSTVFNDQYNAFDNNKLTNLDSFNVTENPASNDELVNKKHLEDELDKSTILRFNLTLENNLKISVENDVLILTKYEKMQITDTSKNNFHLKVVIFYRIGL